MFTTRTAAESRETNARRWPAVVINAAAVLTASLLWACANEPTMPAAPTNASSVLKNAAANAETIPGQYIITFVDSVNDAQGLANKIAGQYGRSPIFTYDAAIKGFAAQLPDQAIDALQHNPRIANIEQDALMQLEASGTELSAPWNLDRIDQRNMPLDGTYSYGADGSGVNVYIIDSGIRTTHVEFGGRAFGVYTAINDGYGTSDCYGHGTQVAAVAGGATYGVAKAAKLYAVRVADCSGYSAYSALVAGIDWVTKNRVLPAVANISIAGGTSSTVNAAVENSIAAGVVYAVAAANYAANACNYSPASATDALTVAASTRDITSSYDVQASYSNFGSCVDLFAPGSAILTATNTSDLATTVASGTSVAAPHVAGVAALYLSAYPSASPAQTAAAILGGAIPGVVSGVTTGTANLLLNSNITGVAPPPPPPDTTSTPAPPPAPSSHPPVATFSVNGCPKSTCAFDGSGSTAVNGIATYSWNFGDGGTSSAVTTSASKVSHSYSGKGSYRVTLTIIDNTGLTASSSLTVSIKK